MSTSAPRRRHGLEPRRDHDVHVETTAGWPLARHAKGNSAMASPDSSRTFDILAQEVEELIERQPQFAFLKPCRQLENHYANKKAGNVSGRHGHDSRSSEAVADIKPKGDIIKKPGNSTIRELLSCDGIELNGFVEGKSVASTARVVTKEYHNGRGHFHRNSGEKIWRISSTRCSIHEKEAHIDLVNPAAAKFLMEMSPGAHASPPAVAVPFKWEDAPGRAKARDAEATRSPMLQLPPRLAVPLQRNTTTALSRQLVISHPLAGIFPCMGAATSPSPPPPQQQHQQQLQQQLQQDHITWMHYRASKSYGGVHRKQKFKSFSQPLASTDQSLPGLKPRRLFSSELADPSTSSSTSSILHGSRQSSSSRTYLSCETDASTPGSKSSSSVSYESIGEDFDHDEPTSASPQAPGQSRRVPGHRRSGLLKLCKSHGNCLRKSKSSRRGRIQCSPEGLATYFQRLDVNRDEPLLENPGAAPTSSGYLNSKGEPLPLPLQSDQPAVDYCGDASSEREIISPKRPTRLPYKMPSVAEQEGRYSKSRHRCAVSVDLQCPSPAYAAALEMLSPAAVTLMTSRRHRGSSRALPPPKPHRRVQFILSMCKTLKRVLFRQQPRRSVIGTRLMYHDERAPTTFQFSKPN